MATTAKSVIQRVSDTLQDPTCVRWSAAELVRYLNDGQLDMLVLRPDALSVVESCPLVAGARQTLPTGAAKLLDVIRNTGGSKTSIRECRRQLLDAQLPSWESLPGSTDIKHFMYDPREPLAFYVYPPAAASGASVEARFAKYPAKLAEPAAGATHADVIGNLSVLDMFANALTDYIVYRAYLKDAEYGVNSELTRSHYGMYANALGIEVKATMDAAPAPGARP